MVPPLARFVFFVFFVFFVVQSVLLQLLKCR